MGKLTSEDDLRAFLICRRYYSFGGTTVFPDIVRLLKDCTEEIISSALRAEENPSTLRIASILHSRIAAMEFSAKYLPSQVREITNGTITALGEIISKFSSTNFIPLFGPTPWVCSVSRTNIKITCSGIFREQKRKHLHIVDFSPFQNTHGMKNDPIPLLKASTIGDLVRKTIDKRNKLKLHLFSISDNYKLLHQEIAPEEIRTESLSFIERLVKSMELGEDYPTLPCPMKCQFKTKCFI